MQQKRSTKIRLIFAALLILLGPALFFYLITRGSNHYKSLEIYGSVRFVKGKVGLDTVYHKATDFALTDQQNKPISFSSFQNKLLVVSLHTMPNQASARSLANLQGLVYQYRTDTMVNFITMFTQPIKVADSLASIHRAKYGKWAFVDSDTTITDSFLQSYFVADNPASNTNHVVILDELRRVRGIYDASDAWDIARLKDEIKVLEFERFGKVFRD